MSVPPVGYGRPRGGGRSVSNMANLTRRRVLAGVAGLGAGGLTYAAVGLSPVRAAVAADGLDVSDAQYDAPDGQLHSPHLAVQAAWSFEGADNAGQVMTALLVDGGLLTTATSEVAGPSDSGRHEMGGVLVDSRTVDSAMWQPPDGGEVSETVAVELRLEVRDGGGATLAKDAVSEDVTITVTDAGPTTTATLSGSGDVSFVPTEGATPTE